MSATLFVISCLISNSAPTGINVKNIITHDAYALDSQAVELNIKNIIVNKTSDNTATVNVLLDRIILTQIQCYWMEFIIMYMSIIQPYLLAI